MTQQMIMNTALLFLLGICGWALFKLLRMPVAALLGTLTIIGVLRGNNISLPFSPAFLSPLVQIMLGFIVGSKITKEVTKHLKEMIVPAAIIVTWALSVVFILGSLLARFTELDTITSMLSCSMGGLPEMTVLAMSTSAEIEAVVIIQTYRMIATIVAFPFIMKYWDSAEKRSKGIKVTKVEDVLTKNRKSFSDNIKEAKKSLAWFTSTGENKKRVMVSLGKSGITLVIAFLGGSLFGYLGIPAGQMIGAMIFIAAASMLGMKIKGPPFIVHQLILVGVGIVVSDNISQETIKTFMSGQLLLPVIGITIISFGTSFLVALLIHKLVKWDFTTCFLAAAPGGFSVMTTLAITYGKDPFRVSILHLCRLITLKLVIPLVFMFFL